MTEFVQRILAELKTNESVNSEPLVKMLVESTTKSITLGENNVTIYSNLKNGLISINESLKNTTLDAVIYQFNKNEETPEAKIYAIAKEADLLTKVNKIKESNAYANPIVKTKVDLFEMNLNSGTPDFVLCANFIKVLEQYSYDSIVGESVKEVNQYLTENQSRLAILSTIYQMDAMRTPLYAGISSNLKEMLFNESYSADVIKLKYGTTVPLVSSLINELRIIESAENGSFTLGEGNYDTVVNDLIAPAIKTKDGIVICMDNRFLSIREASGLTGNETKIHVDEKFKIADLDPTYVKTAYGDFYELCESYVTLGFNKTEDGLGVESKAIRNLTLGFRMNESRSLDLYINGVKAEDPNMVNVSEAISLQSNDIKKKISKIVENIKNLYTFEFIKEVSNIRRLAESMVVKLDETYFICDKINTVDRIWSQVSENQLYEFFKNRFNYNISSIFKLEIARETAELNSIEENKVSLLSNIEKLENSIKKIEEACLNPDLESNEIKKLETIKESIEKTIIELKQEYVRVDLLKKKQLVA